MRFTRPSFVAAAAVGSAAAALARGARPALRVSEHVHPWPSLERPLRVVHLSDVHAGPTTPRALLDEVVETAHRLAPDLLCLTGDYVNAGRRFLPRLAEWVERLPGDKLAVLGNHDHLAGAEAVTEALTAGGAEVLRNRAVVRAGLTVVGVDDGFTRRDDVVAAFAGVESPERALVLAHFPPTAEKVASVGGRLVLAGHTHAGQVELPRGWSERLGVWVGLGPYLRGPFRFGEGTQLYVNAGLGHARRGMRRGEACRPELAVFDLVGDETAGLPSPEGQPSPWALARASARSASSFG